MRSHSPGLQPSAGSRPHGGPINNSLARGTARPGGQFAHFACRTQKPTHETIFEALEREDVEHLEQLLLDGFSRQIYSWRYVDIVTPKMKQFMARIPEMQSNIERLHGKIILNESAESIKQLTSGSDRKYLLGRDRDGRTPLHTAILYDRAELLAGLVQQLPLALRACDNDGRTPLHYAALAGNAQVYRQLVELGAPTTVQDTYLRRPEDYLTDFALQNEFRVKNPIQGNLYHHFYRKSLGSGSLSKLSLESDSSPPLVVVSPNKDPVPSVPADPEPSKARNRASLLPVSNQVFLLNCGENFANENCYDRWWTGSSSRVPTQPARARSKSPMAGGNRFSVRALITEGNLDELEASVLQGFGDRLLGETSQAPLVQEFLDNLPGYLDQIAELHRAAGRGSVRDFQQLLDRPSMILARDPLGATPLHKAVLNGHYDLVEYIVTNYGTSALDAKDNDGRTPLHYAAGLNDDRTIYHLLVKSGAKVSIIDQKQKSAEFYLRSPDELNLTQIRLRSQRLNANYAINLQNRIKSKSPARTQQHSHLTGKSPEPLSSSVAPNNKRLNRFHSMGALDGTNGTEYEADFEPDISSNASNDGSAVSHASTIVKRSKNRGLNGNASPETISSASVRRWISENNIDAFESAVLEGRGEQVAAKAEKVLGELDESGAGGAIDAAYIRETVPAMMGKIKRIHAAVSLGDLTSLKSTVEKRRGYILSKDHLGMTPLHKATIMGHVEVVQYILDKFPETVNARDHEGRTALHYSTATTNKNGSRIYRMLIKAGADARVRDLHGKSADYYRVHLLSLPSEVVRKPTGSDIALTGSNGPGQSSAIFTEAKSRRVLQPMVRDKVTSALHRGDVVALNELILDGFGPELLGRTAYGDEARKLLKTVPSALESIRTMQEAAVAGDHETLMKKLELEPQWAKVRDANSFTLLHLAVVGGHLGLVNWLVDSYPQLLSSKDSMSRTPLHLAALTANTDIYRRLLELGIDARSLDQKGKTAEYYLKNNPVVSTNEVQELSQFASSNASSSSSSSQIRLGRIGTKKAKPTRLRPLAPRKTPEPEDESASKAGTATPAEADVQRRASSTVTPPSTPQQADAGQGDSETRSGSQNEVVQGADQPVESGSPPPAHPNDILATDSPTQLETRPQNDDQKRNSAAPENNDVDAKNDESSPQTEASSRPASVIVAEQAEETEAERVIVYARGQWEDGAVQEPLPATETDNVTMNGETSTIDADFDPDTTNEAEELTVDGTEATSGPKLDRMDTLTEEASNDVTLATDGWIVVDESADHSKTALEQDDESTAATTTATAAPVKTQSDEPSTEMHDSNTNDARAVNDTPHDTAPANDPANDQQTTTTTTTQAQNEPQTLTLSDNADGEDGKSPGASEQQNSDASLPIDDSAPAVAIEDKSIPNKPDTIAVQSEVDDSSKQTNNDDDQQSGVKPRESAEQSQSDTAAVESKPMANGASDMNESAEAPPGDTDEMSATLDALTDEGKIRAESIAEEMRDVVNRSITADDDSQRPAANGLNGANGTAVKNGDRKTEPIDRLNELIHNWLADGDLLRLEHVVIAGQGDRLLGRTSDNQQIQDFLQLVPAYMEKIRKVHGAVSRGDLPEVQKILTRKRFALCRDQFGASPLHLAVLHGHTDVIIYIITQFPETIDGPDNDGQTPLHYAAVAPDKQLFGILETANASKDIKDRFGYTPADYLQNGKLTIRELLIKYQSAKAKASLRKNRPTADLWERPPTAEIEQNLTPDSGSVPSTAKIEQAESDSGDGSQPAVQAEGPQILQIDPRPFPDVESTSGLKEEPLMKALDEIMQPEAKPSRERSVSEDAPEQGKRVADPRKASSDEGTFRRISEEFVRQLKNEKMRLQKSIDSQMKNNTAIASGKNGSVIDSIQASGQLSTKVSGSLNTAKYDLTQIKDEHGRTVLHLAAAKEHSKSTFYKMLAQAPYLIAERDAKYRTIRDIAVMNGIKANLQAIDRFVLDLFLQQQPDTIRMLLLEGYDQVLSVVDSEGNDAISLLKKAGITGMDATIHRLATLQKSRDELHTFIRNGYTEGVVRIMEQLPELVGAKSDHSRTALHLAVLFGNLEIIEKLIEADHRVVNAPDNLGRTPLHYAMAMSKMEEIGRILIHSGANKTVRDVKMRTPTYYFVYKQEIRDIKREEQNLTI